MAKPKEQKRKLKVRRWRILIFGIVVVVVLGTAVLLLKSALAPPSIPASLETSAAAKVVTLYADMAGFRLAGSAQAGSAHESHAPAAPVVIKAKVNEPLTVRLISLDNQFHIDGGGKHQFAIDELKVNIIAPPEGVAQATFTPTEPGTYEFYCDICCGGRANPTMRGQLIVES